MSVRTFVPSGEGAGLRVVVVAAQWNAAIVDRLLAGALEALRGRGVPDDAIEVWRVPGSLEVPLAVAHAIACAPDGARRSEPPAAVVALGCVIRGETEHFRLVADNTAAGLARVALERGVPVGNGVLAVEDVAQAEARAGGEVGNAGAQAALAAVHMANLKRGRWAS